MLQWVTEVEALDGSRGNCGQVVHMSTGTVKKQSHGKVDANVVKFTRKPQGMLGHRRIQTRGVIKLFAGAPLCLDVFT